MGNTGLKIKKRSSVDRKNKHIEEYKQNHAENPNNYICFYVVLFVFVCAV